MHIDTRVARAGVGRDKKWRSVSMPIYQTAIFEHQRPLTQGADEYNYTRLGNPTRTALEETLAQLEGGMKGFAFASGMAAVTAALRVFEAGDHLIATEGLYGHTFSLIQNIFRPAGLAATFVDTSSMEAIEQAWTEKTKGVLVEMPTNPLLKAADLPAIAQLCKARRARLIVDSTFLTPWGLRPLELGADIVVHSASKYLAGHNDTIAGALVVGTPALIDDISFIATMTGAILSPHDSWLTLRGLKTLSLRMERSQQNALAIAQWLADHPKVTEVHYPGLKDHPSHQLLRDQGSAFGSVVSFSVADAEKAQSVLNQTRLILLAESLGGVETLITYPWSQTHPTMPPEERVRIGIHDHLLRLSVGIENIDDLIEDLDQAL